MKYISWNKFLRQGEITHHAVLHRLDPGAVQPLHGHRFYEVFWGVKGECTHIVNGHRERFSQGELILLRRTDIHELVCENDSPCLYYLVSFTNKVFNNIKKRYFPTKQDMWGENNPIPRKYKIPKMLQEWLNAAVQDLVGNPDDSLALDRFLINLVFEIRRIEEEPYYACPEWLSDALERSREPQFFDSGPRILSEISGRTYEHVSRVLKASTGMSPSKFFNRVRVEYAATKLILTDEPIAGIANDCGFSNLGRFYILFKERFNMPPRKYRLRYRTVIPA